MGHISLYPMLIQTLAQIGHQVADAGHHSVRAQGQRLGGENRHADQNGKVGPASQFLDHCSQPVYIVLGIFQADDPGVIAQLFHYLDGYGHVRGARDVIQHQRAGDALDKGSIVVALLLRAERVVRGQVRHHRVDPQT